MTLFVFLVWLQMSAQPQIKIGEIRPMHHRCQVWMGSGWITLQAEMGALLCEEKDGQLVVIGSPDEVQAKDSEVLSWTSANTTEKFFDEAAQRAADETDGLHECKDEADSNCVQAKCCDEKVKGADETDGKPPEKPWSGKEQAHCVLEYVYRAQGKEFDYCLNPVNPTTGQAVKFTQEDEDRILCIADTDGRLGSCEKVLPKRQKKSKSCDFGRDR